MSTADCLRNKSETCFNLLLIYKQFLSSACAVN